MVAADEHAMPQIKPMRSESLDSRIQLQPFATLRTRKFAKPIQQLFAESLRACLLVRHEVIHITKVSPRQTMKHPKTSNGCNLLLASNVSKPITLQTAREQLK